MTPNIEPIYFEIGRQIRGFRVRRGVSQAELGRFLRLTRASVSNIEAGRQRVYVHQLVEICAYFEVEIEQIIPQKPKKPNPQGEDLALLKELQEKLGDESANQIYDLVMHPPNR